MATVKQQFTLKEYKIENAPVGSRFIHGAHSTLLIVTDGKETSNITKSIICVSESGLIRRIVFGTKIQCIKEAKDFMTAASRTIISKVINDKKLLINLRKSDV